MKKKLKDFYDALTEILRGVKFNEIIDKYKVKMEYDKINS